MELFWASHNGQDITDVLPQHLHILQQAGRRPQTDARRGRRITAKGGFRLIGGLAFDEKSPNDSFLEGWENIGVFTGQ